VEYSAEDYNKKIEDYERNKLMLEKEIKSQKNDNNNEKNLN
jgi:hypothetical protein